MQKAAMPSRFLTGCSSKVGLADSESVVSNDELLHQIVARHLIPALSSQGLFFKLTNELIQGAEQAIFIRDLHALDEVAGILMRLPVEAAQQAGLYYHAYAINRSRRCEAECLLQTVADNGPITYRARAIQTLGTMHELAGELDEALRFQLEALRAASDRNAHKLQTRLMAGFEISIIKSRDGDHKGALSGFRSLGPLVDLVGRQQPFYYYLLCNELAVELGELGRIAEAKSILEVALRSPYAQTYPEWAETRQELEAKRTSATPSVVPVRQTPEGIPASRTQPQPCQKLNRVVAFCSLIIKGTAFQITLILIAGSTAIADRPPTIDILARLGRCVRARAPPPQH